MGPTNRRFEKEEDARKHARDQTDERLEDAGGEFEIAVAKVLQQHIDLYPIWK